MMLQRYTSIFAFTNVSIIRVHGIKLNAFWMSRRCCAKWAFLNDNAVSFFNLQAMAIIEQLAQNQYWLSLVVCFPWKCFLSHLAMPCSKIFPTLSNMQSGQFEIGSPTGLPGFCSNTSRTNFHHKGNTLLFKAELKTYQLSGLARCSMIHTLLGIPSGLGASVVLSQTQSTAAINSGRPSSAFWVITTSAGSYGNR